MEVSQWHTWLKQMLPSDLHLVMRESAARVRTHYEIWKLHKPDSPSTDNEPLAQPECLYQLRCGEREMHILYNRIAYAHFTQWWNAFLNEVPEQVTLHFHPSIRERTTCIGTVQQASITLQVQVFQQGQWVMRNTSDIVLEYAIQNSTWTNKSAVALIPSATILAAPIKSRRGDLLNAGIASVANGTPYVYRFDLDQAQWIANANAPDLPSGLIGYLFRHQASMNNETLRVSMRMQLQGRCAFPVSPGGGTAGSDPLVSNSKLVRLASVEPCDSAWNNASARYDSWEGTVGYTKQQKWTAFRTLYLLIPSESAAGGGSGLRRAPSVARVTTLLRTPSLRTNEVGVANVGIAPTSITATGTGF